MTAAAPRFRLDWLSALRMTALDEPVEGGDGGQERARREENGADAEVPCEMPADYRPGDLAEILGHGRVAEDRAGDPGRGRCGG